MSDLNIDEMTEIAALYFLHEVTQDELAKRFKTSRSSISRVLKRAREIGIVDIQVRANPYEASQLEKEFERRFGIKRLLAAVDQSDENVQRQTVGASVASYLDQILHDGMNVAVGMGRNVSAVPDAVGSPRLNDVVFASAIGGHRRGGETINPDHISRRLASRFGGRGETLYVPAVVGDQALKDALIKNRTVRETLNRARRADVALIGLGDLTEDSNLIRMGLCTPQDVTHARVSGTVGDLMGTDFVDIHGRPSVAPFQEYVVGLTMEDLRPVANVIAIASESTKTAVILGALRTGVVDTLATSLANAKAVINLDDKTRPPADDAAE